MTSRDHIRENHDHPRDASRRGASDELFWLALRYAAEELSPEEAEQFESRLADDQRAREALAEAVEFGAAMAVACRPAESTVNSQRASRVNEQARQLPAVRPRRFVRVAWVTAAAAAAVVLAVTLGPWAGSPPDSAASRLADANQGELALTWAESSFALDEVSTEHPEEFDSSGLFTADESSGPDASDETLLDPDSTGEAGEDAGDEANEVEVPDYYSLMAEFLSQPASSPPEDESKES